MTGVAAARIAAVCVALTVLVSGRSVTPSLRVASWGRTHRRPLSGTGSAGRCVIAACAGAVALGLPLWLLPCAGVGGLTAREVVRRRRWAARARRLRAQLPELVSALAAEVRAGAGPAEALVAAATPIGDPLAGVVAGASAGGPAGLRQVAADLGLPGLAAVGAVLSAAQQGGAAVADVLDRLADALADDVAAADHLGAVLSGPRSTALLLTGLPLLGMGLGQAAGAGTAGFLFGQPLGWALCAVAVLLDAAGAAWTRRILRRAVGA